MVKEKEAPNELKEQGTRVIFYGTGQLLVRVGKRIKELKSG